MNICLIEDDLMLSRVMTKFFEMEKHKVHCFSTGDDAYNHITLNSEYDLYVVDINLNGNINGLDILKLIRNFHTSIPVIIITASIEFEPLEVAFHLGCTEYIKKPFNLKELQLRINKSINNKMKKFHVNDDLFFDFESKALYFQNDEIILRKKEKRAIEILIKNFNFIIPNETLEDYIWEGEIKESYPLRQLINTIRNKVPVNFIKTEIGIGYKASDAE